MSEPVSQSSEILINLTPSETRVGVIENGMLQEIYVERAGSRGLVGNLYKGQVVRVLPGMQAAFVDIGLERAAFIHAADVQHNYQGKEGVAGQLTVNAESQLAENDDQGPRTKPLMDNISLMLREGDFLTVQVTRDPIGTKGARLTTHISIPSRYLVYMPNSDHIGISQKIDDEDERERLRSIVQNCLLTEGMEGSGVILRTAAEGAGEQELLEDIRYLHRLWEVLKDRMDNAQSKDRIYEDLPLYLRCVRDLMKGDVCRLVVDSKEGFTRIKAFAETFIPDLTCKIEHYSGERPIFDLYGIEDEIHKALKGKVQLKSGGYLVIDQTEAMITIDVNTGAFVGHRNLEETIYKTNLEAASSIGRQLRLRNLGGIIIIDFIDMTDPEHQRQVIRVLEKSFERDHAKVKLSNISELGLVQMTRKRTRESLRQILCEVCPICSGQGVVKTAETVCNDIFREIMREARAYESLSFLVLASQAVIDRLLDEESASLADLEHFIQKTIKLQVEPMYNQEHYDVILQ